MRELVNRICLLDAMITDNRKDQMTDVMYNNFRFHMDEILKKLADLTSLYEDDLEKLEKYLIHEDDE